MRRKAAPVMMEILFLLLLVCPGALGQAAYEDLQYPPLRQIPIVKPSRHLLPNGMVVFLLEDHQFPLVTLVGRVRASSVYDSPDKVGLAAVTGTMLRTGGSQAMTSDQVDAELDALAANVGISIGGEFGSFNVNVLKDKFPRALEIAAGLLRTPAFESDKLTVAKNQQVAAIQRRNDDADDVAFREFRKLVYGAASPYARTTEVSTINAISREDLVGFHQTFIRPDRILFGVYGDFASAEMLKKLEATFGDWKVPRAGLPPYPPVEISPERAIYFIRKPDTQQAKIQIGHLGWQWNAKDPYKRDYFALIVLNRILGGGFYSRLFNQVRETKGLAYYVFSSAEERYLYPGLFLAACGTKNESTVAALESIEQEIRKLAAGDVEETELKIAKDAILNSFVFRFDTKAKVMAEVLRSEYYGLPLDYLDRYAENVARVTRADLQRVAREFLRPDRLTVLVVGNDQLFDKPLASLGPVKEVTLR